MAKKAKKLAVVQADYAVGHCKPPVEYQFKPGQSGNPAGRKKAGAYIREWLNVFAEQELTEDQLRKIARSKSQPCTKRAAAERALRMMESPDLADFSEYLDGKASIDELRKAGIDTSLVKRAKVRVERRKDKTKVETREIELHDRSLGEFNTVVDTTDGTPVQRQEINETREIVLEVGELAAELLRAGFTVEALPAELREQARKALPAAEAGKT